MRMVQRRIGVRHVLHNERPWAAAVGATGRRAALKALHISVQSSQKGTWQGGSVDGTYTKGLAQLLVFDRTIISQVLVGTASFVRPTAAGGRVVRAWLGSAPPCSAPLGSAPFGPASHGPAQVGMMQLVSVFIDIDIVLATAIARLWGLFVLFGHNQRISIPSRAYGRRAEIHRG